MKVYIVNGYPGVGKTTFENFVLKEIKPFGMQISTVDFVKEIAKSCGWNGVKTPENRKFLSDLKDLLTQWDDVPNKKIDEAIRYFCDDLASYGFNEDTATIFIDCREPSEIEKLKQKYNAKTICIFRETDTSSILNHADAEVDNYEYDLYFRNTGSLEQLKEVAHDFVTREKLFYGYKGDTHEN